MYILLFVQDAYPLIHCISDDIDKLRQYPNMNVDWIDLSLGTSVVWHGITPGLSGWWCIHQVEQI
jgi:hypothetical protein